MKRILILAITASLFTACKDAATETTAKTEKTEAKPIYLGEKITEDGAMPSDSLVAMMGTQTELVCKLSGKIDAVCQKKGCWMELKNTDGSAMRVTFKDYGFFMPKDCAGKTAVVDGIAKVEVTSVADLQEYAKDDGKNKEEIAAITEPKKELVFEAKGVILK
jgi:hypothetical protein